MTQESLAIHPYDEEVLEDPEEQAESARQFAEYQAAPIPSMDHMPLAEVEPMFNPTGIPEDELYVRGRGFNSTTTKPHSEHTDDPAPLEIWRIEERRRVAEGVGMVASRAMVEGTLGDIETFDPTKHLASHHEARVTNPAAATPFMSFSTDPERLARELVLRHGFGVKGGRDSVVVRARVDPDRVLTGGNRKEPEVLLMGGVAPNEYVGAYEVGDFVSAMVNDDMQIQLPGGHTLGRDEALQQWREAA